MLRDAVMVILPVCVALLAAYQLSLHDQGNRAQVLADVVLDRTTHTSAQIANVYDKMAPFGPDQACSPAAVATMRQIDLGSTLLQGVGYVEGATLKCSSLTDARPVAVGPVDYISATGSAFRRNRRLEIAPETPLLLVTGPSGYTALIHPALVFSLAGDTAELPAGLVAHLSRVVIVSSGVDLGDWDSVPIGAPDSSGTLSRGDQLIAWHRSPQWDNFSYAAVPLSSVWEGFLELSRLFVPAGLVGGVLTLMLLRRVLAGRQSLPSLLRTGLRRGEIFVVYQPIADMQTGNWVGAEVLARWQRPGGEMVSPDVFVSIAEKHGLVERLTHLVVEAALRDFADFAAKRPSFFLSINISTADLRSADFPAFLIASCKAAGMPPGSVHLEITEREAVDPEREAESLRTLRGYGFAIGIDDFGIGYSNLAYLDTLQLDYIKIDKAFVHSAAQGELGGEIIDHVVGMARTRHLDVIAEGVEREEQRQILLCRGVSLAQGWLFGRPMSRLDLQRGYEQLATAPVPASVPAVAE